MLLTWKVSKFARKFADCMIVKSEAAGSQANSNWKTVNTIIICLINSDVVYSLESIN